MKMKHSTYKFLMLLITLCFGLIFLMFYWTAIDGVYVNKVLNMDSITYQTDKTTYMKGDTVGVIVDNFCKYRQIAPTTYINLVDTIYYPYEATHRSIDVGCTKNGLIRSFAIIPNVPAGEYHLSGYFIYDVNPIRRGENGVKVPFKTNDFVIAK